MISNLNRLVDELAISTLDPVEDFVISQSYPDSGDILFYRELLSALAVIGLNMYCTNDLKFIDLWAIKTAKKIKALEAGSCDYIN